MKVGHWSGAGPGTCEVARGVPLKPRVRLAKAPRFTVSIPFGTGHLAPEKIGIERERVSTSLRAEAYIEEALRWLPDVIVDQPPAERVEVFSDIASESRTSDAKLLIVMTTLTCDPICGESWDRGWNVSAVGDGRAALEAIRKEKPDLVLTDVMMPELDGTVCCAL